MNSRLDEVVAGLRRQKWVSLALVLLTLVVGIVIGTVVTRTAGALDRSVAPGANPLSIPAPAELSSAFVQISKAVRPSVVNIHTQSTVKHPTPRRRRPREGERQDPFEEFFERFFESPFGSPQGDIRQRSLGSGIVVDSEGYILTNWHVVEKADRIQVKLLDDAKQYKAKVIGSDRETDLAVIKIEAKVPLTPAKMGNSDGIRVGDWVLAIGSPFSLEQTVTAGIISAKNRDLGARQFQHFLQTDAAINPGNSGGPLVNMAGEVIGVSTAIATTRGSYEGVGFALPSKMAVYVYNQIIKHGRVPRGSIGVEFQGQSSENEALLRSFGVEGGVIINHVLPGSPADQGGLKSGDVIVAVDDTRIRSGNELVAKISETPVGDKVRLKYARDGKEAETTITIAERTEVFKELLRGEEGHSKQEEPTEAKFGLTLQNLTPQLAGRLRLGEEEGVLVTKVDPGSFAEDVGLLRADLIVELEREPTRSVEDVRRIQRSLRSGDDVVFKIRRRGLRRRLQTLFLAGTLP